MLFQPSCQVGRSTEIKQRLGQRLQLLEWQGLNLGASGFAERVAAAAELAQGDGCRLGGPTTGLALGFAFLQDLVPVVRIAQR